MFDAIKFYNDHHITYIQGGHKHTRRGWVQTKCPFCSPNHPDGWHLGYCLDSSSQFAGAYSCWKCKGHHPIAVIQKMLGCSGPRAKAIFREYKGKVRYKSKADPVRLPDELKIQPIRMPAGSQPLMEVPAAVDYLYRRKYDPEELEEVWGLKATGPFGNYKYRIILPVRIHGRLVSYQGRDYTGRQKTRYKACSKDMESVHHKNIIGGFDVAVHHNIDHAVVVEGAFDAFRLGPGAVWIFGISYRRPQIAFLAHYFKAATILMDSDSVQAKIQSRKICAELAQRGLKVQEAFIEGCDPGDLPQEEAQRIMDKLYG